MKILVDADGCPVVSQTEKIAKLYAIPLILVKNHSHYLESDYAQIITVDKSRDWADFKIANLVKSGDIVISQDYGLAAMVIAKGGICINQNGILIDQNNIDRFLDRRHQNAVIRKNHKKYTKFKKREHSQNIQFENALNTIIKELGL